MTSSQLDLPPKFFRILIIFRLYPSPKALNLLSICESDIDYLFQVT
jgi:hypothetical protein